MAELSITPRLQLIVIVQKMIILQFSPDHKNGHGNTFTFAFQKECEFPVQRTTAQCARAQALAHFYADFPHVFTSYLRSDQIGRGNGCTYVENF